MLIQPRTSFGKSLAVLGAAEFFSPSSEVALLDGEDPETLQDLLDGDDPEAAKHLSSGGASAAERHHF